MHDRISHRRQIVRQDRYIEREKGAQVLIEEHKGKGIAPQTAARRINADYVVVVDGDTHARSKLCREVRLLQIKDEVTGSRLKGSIAPSSKTKLDHSGRPTIIAHTGTVWS
jgi:hypothetical protein